MPEQIVNICRRYSERGRQCSIRAVAVGWSGDCVDACSVCGLDEYDREFERYHTTEAVQAPDAPGTPAQPSGIEARLCALITARQQAGVRKYGMTLEQNPAQRRARLQHALEEALDLAAYLLWEIERTDAEQGAANSNPD